MSIDRHDATAQIEHARRSPAAASGTRVIRSGMNTSCTREIGRPNSWPPIIAVTYSMTLSFTTSSFAVVRVCSLKAK